MAYLSYTDVKDAYNKMAKEKGDLYANIFFFLLGGAKVVGLEDLLYGYGYRE